MESEKNEKFCENCGAKLNGPYCHECGQKHLEHKHSFIQLFVHFIGDFVHFDSQLFTTLKPLFGKPGLVPKDYVEGRRKRHLDPIRMYIFVSIVFFGLLFSLREVNLITTDSGESEKMEESRGLIHFQTKPPNIDSLKNISEEDKNKLNSLFKTQNRDSLQTDSTQVGVDSIIKGENIKNDSSEIVDDQIEGSNDDEAKGDFIEISGLNLPESAEAYLDQQEQLPSKERAGWIEKNLMLKIIHLNAEAKKDEEAFVNSLGSQFSKLLPKLLFILLPFIALMLKLLYVRRSIYYVDHLIFLIYLFCFIYIVQSVAFLIEYVSGFSLVGMGYLWILAYLYFAMRRFYNQNRWKTIAKYILFLILSLFLATFGIVVGVLISALFI